MKAKNGQVDEELMVIKLFRNNYAERGMFLAYERIYRRVHIS